jgi:hypothetical protein
MRPSRRPDATRWDRTRRRPDQTSTGPVDRWRSDSSGWLRERMASRARHRAGWLLLGGAALGAWTAVLGAVDGAPELLALPLAGFAVYALLKRAPMAWGGKWLRVTGAGLTFLDADSDEPVHMPWVRLRGEGWIGWAHMSGVPYETVAAEVARIHPGRCGGGG